MTRICIVEDDSEIRTLLKSYIQKFQKEEGIGFLIDEYEDGFSFLDHFACQYDIVLMDIEMPRMDGMTAALKMRQKDTTAILIFITNMIQYAVKGYEADALAFMLKPVQYVDFKDKIRKALQKREHFKGRQVMIKQKESIVNVDSNSITYIEVLGHCLTIHTTGEDYKLWDVSLSKLEEDLLPFGFSRCNSCYLVNLKYVTGIEKDECLLYSERLKISRNKKNSFIEALTEYMGGFFRG